MESGGQEGGVDVSRLSVEDFVADDDDAGVAGEPSPARCFRLAIGTEICDSRGGRSCVSFVMGGGGGVLRHCGFRDREDVTVARGLRNFALSALSIVAAGGE